MPVDVRLLSVEDYHEMAAAGIFRPGGRVVLIAGQLVKIGAKGTVHSAAITRTERMLRQRLGSVLIRVQNPVQLDDYSEPEPDIAIVSVDPLGYDDHHPTPSEIYLIVEVADTCVGIDCETKVEIYSRSGIVDYWVLDVNDRQLHIFREPSQNGYQSHIILGDDASISLLLFPTVTVAVREMLRPINPE
jgi:Uma2 family endonuclease